MIYLIAAIDAHRALGVQGKLLCHLPLDLQYFKKNTLNQAILMGRKTFESIGRALPQRQNFVLTRNKSAVFPGCITVTSVAEAIAQKQSEILWVIGGGKLFIHCLSLADKIFLTQIHHTFEGADTFFPELNSTQWQKISAEHHAVSEKNSYPLTFEVYQRDPSQRSG